jgi:serine O-acetyltransferase
MKLRGGPWARRTESPTNVRLGDTNENPRDIGLGALIREDLRTHDGSLGAGGFWALLVHRLGNARMDVEPRALRAPLTLLYRTARRAVLAVWGIDLPYNVKVGRRLRIDHHGTMFLGAREIGDDVHVRNFVTLGVHHRGGKLLPNIGDRVEIGPGACILGRVSVGADSLICGNTVVLRDVPPGACIAGVPGRRIDLAEETARGPRQHQ